MIRVGEARAQAAAIDHGGADLGAVDPAMGALIPQVGNSGRPGDGLSMVGVDPIVCDVGQLIGGEQALVGNDRVGDLMGDRPVGVGAEISDGEFSLRLQADIFRLGIVEGREHIGLAELAVVQKVLGPLVIGVETDLGGRAGGRCDGGRLRRHASVRCPALRKQLLREAAVNHVGPLREDRTAVRDLGRVGGVVEECA